jgi:Protein of unknown function (DUF2752)
MSAALHFVWATTSRARNLTIATMVWFTIAIGSLVLLFFNPTTTGLFPVCPFRALTGLQCPGCGSTRACYQLIHLHPIAAFKLNPLMMLTLPFILYGLAGFTKSAVTGKPQRRIFVPSIYLWAWLVALIFFWVFRNTPWYPFVS